MPARYARLRAALTRLGVAKTELSDVYLRGLCRALEIDFEELRKHL